MPRIRTTDAMFAFRILLEKSRDGQKEVRSDFLDLKKVFDRIQKAEVWFCRDALDSNWFISIN